MARHERLVSSGEGTQSSSDAAYCNMGKAFVPLTPPGVSMKTERGAGRRPVSTRVADGHWRPRKRSFRPLKAAKFECSGCSRTQAKDGKGGSATHHHKLGLQSNDSCKFLEMKSASKAPELPAHRPQPMSSVTTRCVGCGMTCQVEVVRFTLSPRFSKKCSPSSCFQDAPCLLRRTGVLRCTAMTGPLGAQLEANGIQALP